MGSTTTKVCECGCDREVSGRSHQRYASSACRVRDHRRRARKVDPQPAVVAEKASRKQGAVSPAESPSSRADNVTPSDQGRVRMHRRSAPTIDSKVPVMAEKALRRDGSVSAYPSTADVTLSDRQKAVHCAGCAEPMPRLEGPLPVAAYCRGCVDKVRP